MGKKRGRPSKTENALRRAAEQLQSSNLEKRLAAIDSLEAIRTKGAVSLLVGMLYDQSWHVRSRAARLLGRFGRLALPNLLKPLSDGVWYVRAAASIAIGEIGDLEMVDHLLALAEEANRTVRKEARQALAKTVKKNPQLFLKEYLDKREDDFRREFLERLREIDEEAHDLIRPAEGEVR